MPDWRDEIAKRLRDANLPPETEADIAEELSQHLDDRYAELRGQGLSDTEARRGALDELEAETLRDQLDCVPVRRRPTAVPLGASSGDPVHDLWQDLRIGARLLRRTPVFTLVAVLTLALGIGANTTIFSIVNALLLRPLPGLREPNELALIGRTQNGQGFDTFSYADFLDYRATARRMSDIAAYYGAPAHLSMGGASDRVRAGVVSGNYFHTLGVTAALGRTLLPEDDDEPNAHPVVMLSHDFWQRRFGSDSTVVGRRVLINVHSFTVVGVAANGFTGLERRSAFDIFVPLTMIGALRAGFDRALPARDAVWLDLVGRLAPGTPALAAESELRGIASRLAAQYPESNAHRSVAVAEGVGFDPDTLREVRSFSGILFGVVAVVLLIACTNVANLLLARGSARQRELSIRASLGASRSRLVRQLFAEGLLLASLGGSAGLLLGVGMARLMLSLPLFVSSLSRLDPTPDWRVLGFTAMVVLFSTLLFGLPSAFRVSRVELVTMTKSGARTVGDPSALLRKVLLIGQLALSLVLLVAAGLFVRTLSALYAVPPGFQAKQVLIATADVALQGYDEERGRQFYAELERRAAALPRVRSAALAYMLPLGGGGWDTRIYPVEQTPAEDDPGLKTDINVVTPSYFVTAGMSLVLGRGFTDVDRRDAPPAAVVNEAIARQLWPNENPVGKRFRMGRQGEPLTVVGVVRTAKYRTLVEPSRPFFYRPFAQVYQSPMTLHVATAGDPRVLMPAIGQLVQSLDKDLPVYRLQTLEDRLVGSVSEQRTAAALVGAYGVLALLLAAVGVYGSMAYLISRRTREIGIRMALGARAATVLRHVLSEALVLALIGVAGGLLSAIPTMRVLRSQLFGVEPGDPVTFGAVAIVLVVVVLIAALSPARRATRIDPVVALRSE